jgi:carbon storage regulator CsrA
MLVLTRKRSETVCIGQEITVTLLSVGGQTVKIGIDAPSHVRILRGELSGGNDGAKPLMRVLAGIGLPLRLPAGFQLQ